jgi:DNA polymerase III epsilon subunit-like protein
MLICGIDFEATDKDPKTARITEIGAVIFDTENNWEPIDEGYGTLVWDPSYPPLSPEVQAVTGLTDEMLKAEGKPPVEALQQMLPYIGRAEKIIAYNMEYDGTLYAYERKRLGEDLLPPLPREKWLCAYVGVPWPAKFKCRKLSHLALDHGLIVDPATLHRAVGDVKLMGRLLAYSGQTAEGIIAYSAIPWIVVKADIRPPWEDPAGNAKAKERGYSFETPRGVDDGKKFAKSWVKRIKQNELEKEQADAPFPVVQVG